MRRGDVIVLAVIVCVGVGSIVFALPGTGNSLVAVVELHREQIAVVDLNEDQDLTVDLYSGDEAVIQVRDGRVRVIDGDFCPLKICVHTGWIDKRGQSIVCLPNRMIIRVKSIDNM